jgi:ATP-dependent DNA helicase RecQ
MKTAEMVAQEATRKNVENVSDEAAMVLRTMLLVGRNYGVDYLVRLVRGYSRQGWRDPSHTQLETFGTLATQPYYRLKHVVHCMYEFGLVDVATAQANTLAITEKGESFLEKTGTLEVPPHKLRIGRYGYLLDQALGRLCMELAEQKGIPSYEVLTDFTIYRIVRQRPNNLQELRQIPGITLRKSEQYGERILEEIRKTKDLRKEEYLKELKQRVKAPSIQETKDLFLKGRNVAQIAEMRGVRQKTVLDYLISLHVAGELDIRPWIEQNLDAKALYKGAEYFRSVVDGKFREAYEVLGLDYDTLRLVKLYVSDVQSSTHVLEV